MGVTYNIHTAACLRKEIQSLFQNLSKLIFKPKKTYGLTNFTFNLYFISNKPRQLAFKKQNVRKQKPNIGNFKRTAFKLTEDVNIYGIINGA